MLVTLLVLVLLSAGCAAFCCGGRAPFFWLRRCGLTHSLAGQPWLRGPPFSGRHFFGSPKKMPPQQRKDGRVLVLLRSPGLFISVTLKKSCNNKKQKCKDHKKRSTKTSHLTRSEDFFCQFFWFFFVNCLAFSCFSCGFQNMPSWFCLSSSSGGNSFLCIFLVFLVNFAGFQLPMASQRHRVSGTGPNLNVLQQHITSNPSSFCNSRLERRGGHRWPRQDSKAS